MSDIKDQVTNVLSRYRAAVLGKDVDRMIALYANDVRVFDAWGVWTYEGVVAWRRAVEQWFGSLHDERIQVGLEDVKIEGGSNLAVVSAVAIYTAISAGGEEQRSMQNRVTWSLAQRRREWKIAHEHTSAPIEFDTLKAILRRRPER